MYSLNGDIQHMLDEAQVIVGYFYRHSADSRFILYLNSVVLDQTAGKAEGRAIVIEWEEQDGGMVQAIRVSVGVFPIQIAVKDQANTLYMRRTVKGIGDRLVCLPEIAVVVAPYAAVDPVQKSGTIPVLAGKDGALRQRGHGAMQTGQEAIVLH